MLNYIDYIVIAAIGTSGLLAVLRGFLREVVGLLGWVLAFLLASRFSVNLGGLVSQWSGLNREPWGHGIAFFLVFVTVLLSVGGIGQLLKRLVGHAGLTASDRLLGLLFGLARGVLIVVMVFLGFIHFNQPLPEVVSRSWLAPFFTQGAVGLRALLPEKWIRPERTVPQAPLKPF